MFVPVKVDTKKISYRLIYLLFAIIDYLIYNYWYRKRKIIPLSSNQ